MKRHQGKLVEGLVRLLNDKVRRQLAQGFYTVKQRNQLLSYKASRIGQEVGLRTRGKLFYLWYDKYFH